MSVRVCLIHKLALNDALRCPQGHNAGRWLILHGDIYVGAGHAIWGGDAFEVGTRSAEEASEKMGAMLSRLRREAQEAGLIRAQGAKH